MLFAVTAMKMLAELALLALVGHGLLRLLLQRLAPQSLASNPFLWLLATLCRPPLWLVARLSPPRCCQGTTPGLPWRSWLGCGWLPPI